MEAFGERLFTERATSFPLGIPSSQAKLELVGLQCCDKENKSSGTGILVYRRLEVADQGVGREGSLTGGVRKDCLCRVVHR